MSEDRKLNKFIAKAATGTFVLRMFYTGSALANTFLLTRWLGAEGLGVYNYVISWVILAVVFVKCGFEDYLTREIAVFWSQQEVGKVKSAWVYAFRCILLTSAIAALCACPLILFSNFENPDVRATFWVALGLLPLLSLIGIYRGLFRATKCIINSQIPEYLIRPIFIMLCASCFLWFAVPSKPQVAILVNVVATLLSLVYCTWSNPNRKQIASAEQTRESRFHWLSGALPFLLIAGIHIFNQRTDRLMLGSMKDMESVGFYSVAIQMALIVNFPLLGITAAVSPLIAASKEQGSERKTLESALIKSISFATLAALAIVLGMAFVGPYVLPFFGKDFGASYYPMIILACGQLANVAAGPAGTVLSMTRHEKLVAFGVFASAILNIVLNWFLIPRYGIIGASIATSVSMVSWNLILVVLAKQKTGISSNLFARWLPVKSSLNLSSSL